MSNQSASAFDALGDPMRRRLVELLAAGPRPIGNSPAVSKHLKVLSGAGLLEHRSVGTRNLYTLAPDGLAPLQQWLVEQWDTALGAFAAFVAQHGESGDGNSSTIEGNSDGATADSA